MNSQAQSDTKVLSVRLPAEEAKRVDALAQTTGLSRNDYIRMRLKAESTFVDTDELMQLIDALRQVERALDSYLSQLEKLLTVADDELSEEMIELIIEEIANAEALMNLIFRIQKQATRVIRAIRQKVDSSPLIASHD